jgi:hypothetical protein
LWEPYGVEVSGTTGDQSQARLTTDGSGGAIFTWYDSRGDDADVYAQRVSADGVPQWATHGTPIFIDTDHQGGQGIVSDGAGGAYITWESQYDIYVQRVDSYGGFLWPYPGAFLCYDPADQDYPVMIGMDQGGAIVSWTDSRYGKMDIYAQYVDPAGYWGHPAPRIHSVNDVPGDQGGCVNLAFYASQYEAIGYVQYYSVWSAIGTPEAVLASFGGEKITEGLKEVDPENGLPSLRRMELNGSEYFWRLIGILDPGLLDTYSVVAWTLFDSTAACNDYHYFQVIAHSDDPSVFWASMPDSGYSVDNLAPCAPLCLAGEPSSTPDGLVISWSPNSEADLDGYAVYRGVTEGFVPGPGNLLDSPCDTMIFDGGWNGSFFYKVSALDVHGNESDFALLRPSDVTGEDPVPDYSTYLSQNFPNPFNPSTTIDFGLDKGMRVELNVYDTAGRLVRTLIEGELPAGIYREEWDGRTQSGLEAASGIYFYRLVAGDFVQTKKMVLIR